MRSKQTYDGAAVYRLRKLFVRLLILCEYAGKPKNILESFAGQLKHAEKVFYCPYRISARPRGNPAAITRAKDPIASRKSPVSLWHRFEQTSHLGKFGSCPGMTQQQQFEATFSSVASRL